MTYLCTRVGSKSNVVIVPLQIICSKTIRQMGYKLLFYVAII